MEALSYNDIGWLHRRVELNRKAGAFRTAAAYARLARRAAERQDLPRLFELYRDRYRSLRKKGGRMIGRD